MPPRWIYPGASICGVPSEVSRAFLRAWYAQNGVSLENPRLGFVCTAQTTDGQHGLAGYFLEHDHDLAPEERLTFRPGELAPPFDPAAAPKLADADWPAERLAKAQRNYAMEYIRSGLPRLVELLGLAEGAHLGHVAGHLIGAQLYKETAALIDIEPGGAEAFGQFMVRLAAGEGDYAEMHQRRRRGHRAPAGLAPDAGARAAVAGGVRRLERAIGGRACRPRPLPRAPGDLAPRLERRRLRLAHPPAQIAAAALTSLFSSGPGRP